MEDSVIDPLLHFRTVAALADAKYLGAYSSLLRLGTRLYREDRIALTRIKGANNGFILEWSVPSGRTFQIGVSREPDIELPVEALVRLTASSY
jgi:hypothetical protein